MTAPALPKAESSAIRLLKATPFLLMHLACFAVIWTGVSVVAAVLCVVFFFVRMFGVTGGYHRYFSHKTYKTSRPFQFFLAWLGCSAVQKGPLWWAAQHRHHHKYSDTDLDPHSPVAKTVWWSHVGWIIAPDYTHTDWKMIRDWVKFPELRWLNAVHWVPGIVLGAFCFWVGGWSGLVVGFVISTVLLYHTTFLVNSACHLLGKRRYATKDASRNNAFVALLTMGEGWHNNHHHYQNCARQGFFWWEIDMSYYIIKLLSLVGLVWDVKQPPRDIVEGTIAKQQAALAHAGASK